MNRKTDIERSSGNVFADIGFPNPEQALAKAEIARQVNRMIENRGLSQSRAAAILGIDQPRVSALSKGRISLFSLEKLMNFASLLGNEVEISIKASEYGGIRVAAEDCPEKWVLSTMVVGGENIELSVSIVQQQLERKAPIRMDNSAVFGIEENAGSQLVAA